MDELLKSPVTVTDKYLQVHELKVYNREVVAYFKDLDPAERVIQLEKSLEMGVLVLSRIDASQASEFLNVKIAELFSNVKHHFNQFDQIMKDLLIQSLDPAKADSFLARTQFLINSQVDKVNSSLLDVVRDARSILTNEISKVQMGREILDKKMDPNNNTGYIGSLVQKMTEFERQMAAQFSETDRASFVGKLKEAIAEHFGKDGKVLSLIEQKLLLDAEGRTPLSQMYLGLKNEISSLRDAVMKLAGQQELLETTTKKGFTFEIEVFDELQKISHPFGDIVEDTSLKVENISGSKKGDYVYQILETKQRIVIDAKNYNKLKSLTAMLEYIKEAMHERTSKFGIIVAPDVDSLQKQIGTWNVYDNCIITTLDSLEMSVKYAKYVMQYQEATTKTANIGIVKQKISSLERKVKEITSLKSKLTKISNGVVASVTDLHDCLDGLRQDFNNLLQEISTELNK